MKFSRKEKVSTDVIQAKIGGQTLDYNCCELEQSIEYFKMCKADLLETMDASGLPVLYFEEYKTDLNKIISLILHQKQAKGIMEHVLLHILTHTNSSL